MHSSNAASLGIFDVRERRFMRKLSGMPEFRRISSRIFQMNLQRWGNIGGERSAWRSVTIRLDFWGAVDDIDHAILLNMGTGGQVSVCSDIFFGKNMGSRRLLR